MELEELEDELKWRSDELEEKLDDELAELLEDELKWRSDELEEELDEELDEMLEDELKWRGDELEEELDEELDGESNSESEELEETERENALLKEEV